MEDADLADGDLLSNKVEINFHMLGALMLNGVGGEVDGTNVVTVDQRALRQRTLEHMEQLPQPSGLSHTIGDSTVLGLHAKQPSPGQPNGRLSSPVLCRWWGRSRTCDTGEGHTQESPGGRIGCTS
jgi:hypothetical protein